MKRLSIIIVTYNSEKDIYDCIKSIRQWTDIPMEELELIVVDNNSRETDKMFAQLQQLYGNDIVLIKNTRNGGYGQGNNLGIRKATAPVVLIMNPDVRLMEPVFKTALNAFDQSKDLSVYGMKQMLSATEPSTNSFCCAYTVNGYLQTFMTSLGNRYDHYLPRYMHFSGSCFFIRKEMFEQVGLFDETIFMYGEEEDIHYRMRKMGFSHMVYNPGLHYIHLTKEREPNIAYETKLLDVAIAQSSKKGCTERRIIKNRLRNNTILLLREKLLVFLGKKDKRQLHLLEDFRKEIKQRLKLHD
ncbi:MAG: glycosyltransferase family 2 protein [Prevotella sp.]